MSTSKRSLAERAAAPTPRFFKRLRLVGLCLAAAGGAILGSPIALPAAIVAAAGYVAVAGGVLTAVSQLTVEGE